MPRNMNNACSSCAMQNLSMHEIPQTLSGKKAMQQFHAHDGAYKRNSNDSSYIPVCHIPIYLGGKAGTEQAVLYSASAGSGQRAELQRREDEGNPWITEYTLQSDDADSSPIMVLTGYLEEIGSPVCVLYTLRGAEGFLSYKVLARKKGRITVVAERKDIYQGGIWFDGGRLIEAQGNRYRMWVSMRRRLCLVPYRLPKVSGAVQVRYYIEPDGRIRLSARHVILPVGAVVQIQRADRNELEELIQFKLSPSIKMVEHRSAFRFTGPGRLEFLIKPRLPRGSGKERFAEIVIETGEH